MPTPKMKDTFKKKKPGNPQYLLKALVDQLSKLGFKVRSREKSGGAFKAWLESEKPIDLKKVTAAVSQVSPAAEDEKLYSYAETSITAKDRSFRISVQTDDPDEHGPGTRLFVAVTRPTEAGKRWDAGEDT